MTTDFRALCAELHEALEKHCETLEEDQLLDRSAAALRAALAAEPEPAADGEMAELVAWLREQEGGIGRRATYSRIADLLERLAEPEPVGATDEEIIELMPQQMRDDLAAAARAMAGFAVLARWGQG